MKIRVFLVLYSFKQYFRRFLFVILLGDEDFAKYQQQVTWTTQ